MNRCKVTRQTCVCPAEPVESISLPCVSKTCAVKSAPPVQDHAPAVAASGVVENGQVAPSLDNQLVTPTSGSLSVDSEMVAVEETELELVEIPVTSGSVIIDVPTIDATPGASGDLTQLVNLDEADLTVELESLRTSPELMAAVSDTSVVENRELKELQCEIAVNNGGTFNPTT